MSEQNYDTLDMNRNAPCHECPFVGNIPGWIGEHESAQDFIDNSKNDQPYPYHSHSNSQCCGQAHMMNQICKMSRHPKMASYQRSLREKTSPVMSQEEMLETHDGYLQKNRNGKR